MCCVCQGDSADYSIPVKAMNFSWGRSCYLWSGAWECSFWGNTDCIPPHDSPVLMTQDALAMTQTNCWRPFCYWTDPPCKIRQLESFANNQLQWMSDYITLCSMERDREREKETGSERHLEIGLHGIAVLCLLGCVSSSVWVLLWATPHGHGIACSKKCCN